MQALSSATYTHTNHTRSWTFLSSWRSAAALSLFLLVAAELVCLVTAASMQAQGKPGKSIFVALSIFIAWVSILVARPLISKRPYLQFDRKGISGKAMKRKPIAWPDVVNFSLVNHQLRIELQPQAFASSSRFGKKRTPQRAIALGAVPAAERPAILRAAHDAFLLYFPASASHAAEATRAEMQALAAFEVRLRQLTPRVWAMPAMVALCVLVWIANVASGMDAFRPDSADLYRWGANATSAVQAGQWWRLVTAMFLHGGIAHLALNMFALWEAGKLVSRLFGNRGFLLIYFGSGIAGGALSLHFASQTLISVGASGAIFGVMGALLAAVIQHRGQFPVTRSRQLMTGLGIFIVYSLGNGFLQQRVDNAAHIGGLLAGMVMGWLLIEKLDDAASKTKRFSHFIAAGLLCAVSSGGIAVAAPPAQRDLHRYFADLGIWQSTQPEIERFQTLFRQEVANVQTGQINETILLQHVQTVYLPMVHGLVGKLSVLNFPVNEMPDRYIRAQREWLKTTEMLMQAQVEYLQFPTLEHAQAIARLADELKKARADLDKAQVELSKMKSA